MISVPIRPNDFVNGTPSDAEAVDLDFNTIYDKVSEILYAFQSASIGESGADIINSSPIEGLADGTIQQKLQDLKDQLGAAVTGTIPDASLEIGKLVVELQNFISDMRKLSANTQAQQDKNNAALPNMRSIYDLFDGTNTYSVGKIDTLKTRTTASSIPGAINITVDDATGFIAKNEYTIQNATAKESFVLTSVSGLILTVPALTNAFAAGAVVYRSNVLQDQGRLIPGTIRSTNFPISLDGIASIPAGIANGVACSPDGKWLAVTSTTTPYLIMYKRTGDTFVKQTDLDSKPTSSCYCVAFSADGTRFTVGTSGTYRAVHYKIVDDVFIPLTHPTSYPSSTVYGASYSPDGTFLSLGLSSSPYVFNYSIEDDVYEKLTDPETKPTGSVKSVSFSHDGNYLAVVSTVSPYVLIYKRTLKVFDKLTNPAILPAGDGNGVSWGKNDLHLAVAHDTTPFVTIYKRSGDTFTKLTSPLSALPPGNANGVAFSADGSYLSVAHEESPFIASYNRTLDTFTKLPNPLSIPSGIGNCVAYGFNDLYLFLGHAIAPYLDVYKVGTQVSSVDARYSVAGTTNEVDLWLYREKDTNYSIATGLSIVASTAAESFATMTKVTTDIATNLAEDKFTGTAVAADSKVTVKLTITRAVATDKAITKLLGAVV